MHAPGFNPERARLNSIADVGNRQAAVETTLAQILTSPTSDPAAKRAVAQAIADGKIAPVPGLPGFTPMFSSPYTSSLALTNTKAYEEMNRRLWASEALRLSYARYAAASGTPEMKKTAAVLLGAGTGFHPNMAYDIFGKKLQSALERGQKEEGSPMKRLGQLLYAQELGKDPKWADKVQKDLLETLLARQLKEPTVAAALAKMHEETMSQVRSSDAFRRHVGRGPRPRRRRWRPRSARSPPSTRSSRASCSIASSASSSWQTSSRSTTRRRRPPWRSRSISTSPSSRSTTAR
jgi:hypothetical protein